MNRLSATALPPVAFDPVSAKAAGEQSSHASESGRFAYDQCDRQVAWYCPLHYEPNYAYPLVIWLHGPDEDESQLHRIMPLISLRNYVAAAIRGPEMARRKARRPSFGWSESVADVAHAEERVHGALERARDRFHVARNRIFIAGYDAGGTMAFRLAMRRPATFAGAISLAGPFPAGDAPLARLTDARHVPLFLASGRNSRKYSETRVCRDLKLLHAAGLDVSLRLYPCGHELDPRMLADMNRWIMEQIGAVAASV